MNHVSLLVLLLTGQSAIAGGNCAGTGTGLIPLTELTGTYQGQQGYLYDGSNVRPRELTDQAPKTEPISGKVVLASLGMSNVYQEFEAFIRLISRDPSINPDLLVVNTASGGCVAKATANPAHRCWAAFEDSLLNAGVTFEDVQILWLKTTTPTRGTRFPKSKDWLLSDLRATLDTVNDLMPNLKQIYVSSRIYAGYANTPLNPEPYSYESAFAFKELVGSQHPGLWISWGPYLWADGVTAREDGLVWNCDDFQSDGTHPSNLGSKKVARQLVNFFKKDEVAREWFLEP